MFTGFNLKYPEYSVLTPHTNLEFNVRTLNVQEEEKLKGSLLTPSKMAEHLNKCIYEVIVSKPESITDYKSFLKALTLKDRDALLYGLYHVTYEEIRNYEVKCAVCKKEYQVTATASSMFNFKPYPEEDILNKRIAIPLPISKGVTVFIRQPSLEDEEQAVKNMTDPTITLEMVVETLIIDRFEQDIETSKEPFVVAYRPDIITAYGQLPARDKRLIYERYTEEFGKYGIELKMKTTCTGCGNEEIINVDLVENFFRMVYTS